MRENDITGEIVDAAYQIHTRLGAGLLESVYEGVQLGEGFRADFIVENLVIIELKSVEIVAPVHKKQLLTYLRLANKHLGLLINFNTDLIKNGITRIVNNL